MISIIQSAANGADVKLRKITCNNAEHLNKKTVVIQYTEIFDNHGFDNNSTADLLVTGLYAAL